MAICCCLLPPCTALHSQHDTVQVEMSAFKEKKVNWIGKHRLLDRYSMITL